MSDLTPLEIAERLDKIAILSQDVIAIQQSALYMKKIAAGEYRQVVHAKSVFVNNGKVERWCSRCDHIIPKYAEWCPFCGALMEDLHEQIK